MKNFKWFYKCTGNEVKIVALQNDFFKIASLLNFEITKNSIQDMTYSIC